MGLLTTWHTSVFILQAPADYGPASISIDLQVCKKTVLKPYLFILKVVSKVHVLGVGQMCVNVEGCTTCIVTKIVYMYTCT